MGEKKAFILFPNSTTKRERERRAKKGKRQEGKKEEEGEGLARTFVATYFR